MFIYTKRFFQLSLITLLATLLFLGTAGVNTALADHDDMGGVTAIKEICFDNVTGKNVKTKIKSRIQISVDPTGTNPSGTTDTTPFPSWDSLLVVIDDFDGVAVSETWNDVNGGIAITENFRKGKFEIVVVNGGGNRVLSLSGGIKADAAGNGQKIKGKIVGHDSDTDCSYRGKFKAKLCTGNNPCPDL